MTDLNPGFGLFVLGQRDDIRRLARQTAEPWAWENANSATELRFLRFRKGRAAAEQPATRPDFLVRLSQLFAPVPQARRCCSEPLA